VGRREKWEWMERGKREYCRYRRQKCLLAHIFEKSIHLSKHLWLLVLGKVLKKIHAALNARQIRFVCFFNLFIPFFSHDKKNGNEAFLAWRYRCTVRACLPEMRIFVRHVVALFCQYLGEIKRGGKGSMSIVESIKRCVGVLRSFLPPLFPGGFTALQSHRLRNLISSLLIEKYVLSMSKCFCGNRL